MTDIGIRSVKPGDEHILAHIQSESWRAAFCKILSAEDLARFSDADSLASRYAALLESGADHGYLLFVDDAPHCIAFWDNAREENMPGYAELICIHSLQDNWGKGYGSFMLEHIMCEAKSAGFQKMMLWVFEENTRARRFYEKHGFTRTGQTKTTYGADEIMYVRDL